MKHSAGARRDYRVEGLEPRLLLSADPLGLADSVLPARHSDDLDSVEDTVRELSFAAATGTLSDAALLQPDVAPDATQPPPPARLEIVFVDAATPDYATLVDNLLDADPQRDLRIHVLDAGSDGFQSIAEILSGYDDVDAVHVISHGNSGSMILGDAVLNAATLDAHAQSLAAWGENLTEDADLLIYGCDFAAGEEGRALVARLATLTGADIAASTDLTGAAALGGDWDLEHRFGQIEAAVALDAEAQQAFVSVLGAPTPLGTETLVNINTSGVQDRPSVATFDNGDYVVAWQDNTTLNSGEILFRRFFADGTPKDAGDVAAHSTALTNETRPDVAVSGNGNFVITWQTDDGTQKDVMAALFASDGSVIRSAFSVNTDTGVLSGDQHNPSVAMRGNGQFVIAWQGTGAGDSDGIFARQFKADGTPKSGGEFLVNSTTSGSQTDPVVAMGSSGAFVIAYVDKDGVDHIDAVLYNAGGNVTGNVTVNVPGANDAKDAAIGMNGSDGFVVAWQEDVSASEKDIFHRVFNSSGVALDTDGVADATANNVLVATNATGQQSSPDVDVRNDGSYVIVWDSDAIAGDAQAGIAGREYAADGAPRDTAEFRVNTSGAGDQTRAAVAAVDGGGFIVTWQGNGTQTSNVDAAGVFAQRFNAGTNTAPTVALANTTTNLAENTSTTTRVKVADINVTDDGLGTNNVTLTGTDAALFEVDGTELFIKAGTTLDFETNPTLDVTVNVDDATVGGTPDDTAALSISLSDVNEAPSVALNNTVTNLAENTNTTSRVKVADITVTDDALGSETLALTGTDAALFEIDGSELFLKAGVSLDHETNATLDVTVSVDDTTVGATPDDTAALAINVTDVNEAPTVALANTVTSLAENTDTTARVKVADINITDDALGAETITLTGTDAALFEVDGTELFIKAGTALDFEANATLDVTVNIDDNTVGGNPDDTAALSISLSDVNEAPSVALANTTNALADTTSTAARIKVADINVSDDALGSETLALTGADAALFEIDGTELFIKAGTLLNATLNPSLDVTVNVDDVTVGGIPDDTAALSIAVTNGNTAPTVSLANTVTNIAENTSTASRVKVADVVVSDDGNGTNTLALAGADASLFEIDGTELFVKAGTTLDFESDAALDVTVTVDDATLGGNPDDTAALTVNVTDVNEAPTVTLANTVTNIAENTDTAARIKVADISIADDALGAETLALTGTDAALFEIDGTQLFLKAGTTLDFETNATLDVTVNVDDNTVGGNPDDTAALAINVFDVNETPSVALSNAVTNLTEDTNTAARVKVADISITDDALGAETLALTGTDAALFEIDGTELFLKAGTTLDFETNATLDVTVTVDDNTVGGNPDDTAALAITVTDANEAPSVALANTVTNLAENTDTTARVKVADINITDDALGTESITLTGTDAALFEVDGTELFIKAGTALDFETNATLDVTVNVDDTTVGSTPDDTAALSIGLTDVNEAPSAVTLGNATTNLADDTDTTARLKVADINVSDDALGTETLTLAGTDAALFEIDGTELFLKAGTALDSDAKPNLSVTVNVDDTSVGATPDATVVLAITVSPPAAPEETPAAVDEEEEVAPAAAPVVAEVELVLEGAEDEEEAETEPEAAEVEAEAAAQADATDEPVPEDELDPFAAAAGAADDGAGQVAGATGAEQGRGSRDGAESGSAVGPVSVDVAASANQVFAGAAPGEFVQVDALLGSLLNQFFTAGGDGSGREGDGAADTELAPVELVKMDAFVSGIDRLREQAEQEAALVKAVVSTGVAASTGVSVGYVVWLIRGGVLLSSVLSSMPAWRFIDPLPILDSAWEATDGDGDDDSLESMVARAADRAGAA